MKRAAVFACVALAAAVAASVKPLALSLTLTQLKKQLKTEDVRIVGFRITWRLVGFSRLEVRKPPSLVLTVENAALAFDGKISAARISYNKLVATDVKGRLRLRGRVLEVSSLSAGLLDGTAAGELRFLLRQGGGYEARFDLRGLSLERCYRDLELQEKLEMTGKMSGSVMVKGSGSLLETLSASFTGEKDGGVLTVKDMSFLEHVAARSRQPVEMLADGFRDYRYEKSSLTLALEKNNLTVNADMDGNKGKRNLTLVVHGFRGKGEE